MNVRVPRGTSVKQIQAMGAVNAGENTLSEADAATERLYVGSLTSSGLYPRELLVKKTIAVGTYHIVSYFKLDDVISGKLATPCQSVDFATQTVDESLRELLKSFTNSSQSPTRVVTPLPQSDGNLDAEPSTSHIGGGLPAFHSSGIRAQHILQNIQKAAESAQLGESRRFLSALFSVARHP